MWTTTKPNRSGVKCEYEYAEGERYIGVTYVGKGGLLFRGTMGGNPGGIHCLEVPVADAKGRWFIVEVPDPPKRMTPGQVIESWRNKAEASREEAMRIRRTIKGPTDAETHCNIRAEIWDACANELTAAIAAAKRGELLMEEVSE